MQIMLAIEHLLNFLKLPLLLAFAFKVNELKGS